MRADVDRPAAGEATGRIGLFAWCTYDWANHGFPVVIATFVFPAYFAKAIAPDPVVGTSYWAYAMSASALAVAAVSPVLGAIADRAGRRKPWVAAFTLLCVASTAMLWFARPEPSYVLWTLVFAGIGNFAFETGWVFYSAMLPSLAPREWIGRLSGWGWSLGYAGGLCCLVVALVALIRPNPPLFGLDAEQAEPVRAVALLVALWFGVFSLPFFLITPDIPATGISRAEAIRQGFATLRHTIQRIRDYRQIALFLLARMIFTDGLNTLFAVGGIYAAVTFGMNYTEILMFGIAMNVSAGTGAFAFGWLDDRIGPKQTILIALAALTVIGTVLLLVHSRTLFWVFALQMGLFFGPAQSASRSLMARMAPPDMVTEMFGLFALTGKATAFMGPALFGWVTALSGSQRVGLSTVLVFLLVGGLLLVPVRHRYEGTPASG
jgi:MFS transporter, UMF1 family